MVVVQGVKLACMVCIRGHRATNCMHANRELHSISSKGRPSSQCDMCKEKRLHKGFHGRCSCRSSSSSEAVNCGCEQTGMCLCCKTNVGEVDDVTKLPAIWNEMIQDLMGSEPNKSGFQEDSQPSVIDQNTPPILPGVQASDHLRKSFVPNTSMNESPRNQALPIDSNAGQSFAGAEHIISTQCGCKDGHICPCYLHYDQEEVQTMLHDCSRLCNTCRASFFGLTDSNDMQAVDEWLEDGIAYENLTED